VQPVLIFRGDSVTLERLDDNVAVLNLPSCPDGQRWAPTCEECYKEGGYQ
jgi:hypothetical protein